MNVTYAEGSMSKESARQLVREWVDERTKRPTEAYARSQMRWLMIQLADRCVEESLRLSEGVDELTQRLETAYNIIHDAWYAITQSEIKNVEYVDLKDIDVADREKMERARNLLWARHDVKRAFSEGTKSDQYPAIDKELFIQAVAEYLARPYLRNPVLDYILLDISISREIAAYGESLKENWIPGKRNFFNLNERYIKSTGNLAEMTKVNWKEVWERIGNWFWWSLGFPFGVIWLPFHFHYTTLGYWLAGAYAVMALIYLLLIAFTVVRWGWRKFSGFVDPKVKAFRLWDEMYEVWKLLEGPIVNPANVRDAMVLSRSKGAVWDNAAWSLIDRVVANDAAVWVVQPFS